MNGTSIAPLSMILNVTEIVTTPTIDRHNHTPSVHWAPHSETVRQFPIDPGHEGFMIFSSSVLWLLIPGSGFFYSGMARSKSALTMLLFSLWSISIASIQWWAFGYSLAFSLTSGNSFVGDFTKAFYIGVLDNEYPTAPKLTEMSFCFYQGVSSAIPAALISGAFAERAKVFPALIFIFLWNTLVYCPCAYWSLNPNGWSYSIGILDFGGGAPVHVPASAAALAYSYVLGPRDQEDRKARPHNMFSLVVGTVLIWFGSFGYNPGSAFGATLQAVFSCVTANLCGSVGAVTWGILDYMSDGHWGGYGFCAGAVIGLITITPASGFVNPAAAIPFGIVSVVACRWAFKIKHDWKFDDSLDVFAIHGVAGIVGILFTGIFAQRFYGGEEVEKGGVIDGNYMQVFIQLADTTCGFFWSLSVSLILLLTMNKIPSLRLRLEDPKIDEGIDQMEFGVSCYEYLDEIKLDWTNWKEDGSSNIAEKYKKWAINLNHGNRRLSEVVAITPISASHFPQSHSLIGDNNKRQQQANIIMEHGSLEDLMGIPNNWRNYWR